jgi:radical SAM superfamily enzyme
MGTKYSRDPFKVFTIDEYTDFIAEFIPLLRPDIVLQRLFGLADFDLLIAPNWGMKKSQIQSYIDKRLEAKGVIQGSAYKPVSVLLV